MKADKIYRVDANEITAWASACVRAAGASEEIANALAKGLVAGDLMGFRTHGLLRLRYNLQCLLDGRSKSHGEPTCERARKAMQLWDAEFLPGPYVMPLAIDAAIAMARDCGTGTVVMKRAQHVAALAVYLEQAISQGLLIQIVAATPAQKIVAAHGAKSASFSPNPFAIGAPATKGAVLFDISLSMTAAGKVRTAIAERKALPYPALITSAGDFTADASQFVAEPGAVIASLGGEQLGYKGTGLNLYSELWTLALSQYGREQAEADGDANTVWIQIIDPTAFGPLENFKANVQEQIDAIQAAEPIAVNTPVRVPGQGALAHREQQLADGITYTAPVWKQLQWCAEHMAIPLPPSRATAS